MNNIFLKRPSDRTEKDSIGWLSKAVEQESGFLRIESTTTGTMRNTLESYASDIGNRNSRSKNPFRYVIYINNLHCGTINLVSAQGGRYFIELLCNGDLEESVHKKILSRYEKKIKSVKKEGEYTDLLHILMPSLTIMQCPKFVSAVYACDYEVSTLDGQPPTSSSYFVAVKKI